jgi:hypothetical protein
MVSLARCALTIGLVLAVAGCGASGTPAPAPSTAAPIGASASAAVASPAAPAAVLTDACTLITDAEIAAVTGLTPSDHSSVPSRCEWDALQAGQNIASPLFYLTINQTASATAAYQSSTPLGGSSQYPFTALTIPGVDQAAGSAGELHALVHGTFVVIIVGVGGHQQDWAPALMAKIAPRL